MVSKKRIGVKCNICCFATFCLSDNAPRKTLTTISEKTCKRNERLLMLSSTMQIESVYVVKAGILKLSFLEIEGKERILGFYLPGEVFGLETISHAGNALAVRALTETVLCKISFQDLLSTISLQPELQQKLLQICSQWINVGRYINCVRAEQRMAGFLLEFSQRLQVNNKKPGFTLPMSRQAIGNYLGLASETVIRILKLFHHQGIINISNKHIKLLNVPQLEWLLQGGLMKNFSQTTL